MSERENIKNPYRRPTAVAGTVLAAGLLASIAGNIQSVLLNEGGATVGSMISALWWPAILFGMIELAIHTPWAKSNLDRIAQWVGAGLIGALAFYISYFHLAHVLSYFGYDVVSRYIGPVAVDVAMMVATVALNRVGQARREMATPLATEPEATPLATAEMATAGQPDTLDELAMDWATLDEDLDRDLAEMVAAQSAEDVDRETAEAAQETTEPTKVSTLTKVPAAAAEMILAGLADHVPTSELDAKVAAENTTSTRTARRWRGAVANGTARVS